MSGCGALGAASSRVACGPRRRRSGAFAAELLLPSASLAALAQRGQSPGDPGEFKHLMHAFGVGATTAAYHLWNQGYLGSEEERDWLVDEYGRQP